MGHKQHTNEDFVWGYLAGNASIAIIFHVEYHADFIMTSGLYYVLAM